MENIKNIKKLKSTYIFKIIFYFKSDLSCISSIWDIIGPQLFKHGRITINFEKLNPLIMAFTL